MQRVDAHRFKKDPAAFIEGFLYLALNDVKPPVTLPQYVAAMFGKQHNYPHPTTLVCDFLDVTAVLTVAKANLNLDVQGTHV